MKFYQTIDGAKIVPLLLGVLKLFYCQLFLRFLIMSNCVRYVHFVLYFTKIASSRTCFQKRKCQQLFIVSEKRKTQTFLSFLKLDLSGNKRISNGNFTE